EEIAHLGKYAPRVSTATDALVRRLNVVYLYVSDMQRSLSFYGDLLGIPLEGDEHWQEAPLGSMRFALHLAHEGVGDLSSDTVHPPGNETAAAELLRDYLAESGVESELYAKVPERANLVARIPGSGDGPSFLLLSHTDTVVADPAEWQVDPWSGELRDGEIW